MPVCPEKVTRRKKRKKTRMAIAKLLAFLANAIISSDPDKSDSSSDESLRYESDEKLEYWNGGKQGFSHQVVVDLILHEKSERECSKKPVGVTEKMSFLINFDKLAHKNDWTADDLGGWENRGNHAV